MSRILLKLRITSIQAILFNKIKLMKKFLIALTLIIVANLGCKKEEIGERGPCACSPINYPYLSLVVKNAIGEDLLNSKTSGSFSTSQIKLYLVEANGATKSIDFGIRSPFSYGSNQFTFYQLYSEQIVALTASSTTGVFYLKFADLPPYKLSLKIGTTIPKVEKLLINDKEAIVEAGPLQNYIGANIFYLEF
jgi:hypothetical protein